MSNVISMKEQPKKKPLTRGALADGVDSALCRMRLPRRPLFPGEPIPEFFKDLMKEIKEKTKRATAIPRRATNGRFQGRIGFDNPEERRGRKWKRKKGEREALTL